jgi:hypothetical protein
MSSILILGPSTWTRRRGSASTLRSVRSPGSVEEGGSTLTPLEARRLLARALNSAALPAVLFEDWPKESRHTLTQSFRQLIQSVGVRSFFVLWPRGTSLLGVNWELGLLADRVESGRLEPRKIVPLSEEGIARVDTEAGRLSIGEPGNRTRYFQELLTWGCTVILWSTYPELLRGALGRARELREDERARPRLDASPQRLRGRPPTAALDRLELYDRLLRASQLTESDAIRLGREIRRRRSLTRTR